LIAAVSVYEGELLPGFYEDWVSLERDRVQAIFEQKMKVLLDRLVGEHRWAEVLDRGERWIALGNTPEPAYRALMVAHAALGDVSSVAAVYRRCSDALSKELGVEPSDQTRAVYERLSKGEIRGYELRQHVSTGEFGSSTGLTIAWLGVRWRSDHLTWICQLSPISSDVSMPKPN
jgi:DNA-binding SARP family transcriptional activator